MPASLCFKRNTHKRSRKDVERVSEFQYVQKSLGNSGFTS